MSDLFSKAKSALSDVTSAAPKGAEDLGTRVAHEFSNVPYKMAHVETMKRREPKFEEKFETFKKYTPELKKNEESVHPSVNLGKQ